MAKFLTTTGNSFYIEQIAIEAQEELVLVTPFLSLSKALLQRLSDADQKGVHITLIYGKSKLNKSEDEFSERNNREMGVYISKEEDAKLYQDTQQEVQSIINSSRLERDRNTKTRPKNLKIEHLLYLEDGYDDGQNFYQPSLKRVMEAYYGDNLEVEHSKSIADKSNEINLTIHPPAQVNYKVGVSHRITVNFSDPVFYDFFQSKMGPTLENELHPFRVYWNNLLCIYLPKRSSYEVNQNDLERRVRELLDITLLLEKLVLEASEMYQNNEVRSW